MRRSHWRMVGLGSACLVWATVVHAETGRAILQATSDGSSVTGAATLTDTPGGLTVEVQVSHVSPGKHGLHIHEYGACGDGGRAAGSHYNPSGVAHGFLPRDGVQQAHPGDLGNIEVASEGTGTLALVLPGVSLSGGAYSVAGRAIVLHELVDDFGQPTGNAGGRIGCGTILITASESVRE